jgi:hypothetical protein
LIASIEAISAGSIGASEAMAAGSILVVRNGDGLGSPSRNRARF